MALTCTWNLYSRKVFPITFKKASNATKPKIRTKERNRSLGCQLFILPVAT